MRPKNCFEVSLREIFKKSVMRIIQSKTSEYKIHIIALYIEAFSTGPSQQYIDMEELNQYIDLILLEGYALLAIENEEVNGAVLICPLHLDKALPKEISEHYPVEKCVYVAEMMVAEKVRGMGIGKQLLTEFFSTVDKQSYSDAFIRVWNENIPAISLYRQMGFESITTIEQVKEKADRSGTFVMQKVYLHKKMN